MCPSGQAWVGTRLEAPLKEWVRRKMEPGQQSTFPQILPRAPMGTVETLYLSKSTVLSTA